MLTLFDALYNCGFDGDLSRWLLPEESEPDRPGTLTEGRSGFLSTMFENMGKETLRYFLRKCQLL